MSQYRNIGMIKIFILLLLFIVSCNNQSEIVSKQTVTYFGKRFILSDNIDDVNNYLLKEGLPFEYNDSFSGEDEGIKEYQSQGQTDSVKYWVKLHFKNKHLISIAVDFTSSQIKNEFLFLDVIRREIRKSEIYTQPLQNGIAIDTSIVVVNPLESSSGKAFRIKVFYR